MLEIFEEEGLVKWSISESCGELNELDELADEGLSAGSSPCGGIS
jgi:hypothetical protein